MFFLGDPAERANVFRVREYEARFFFTLVVLEVFAFLRSNLQPIFFARILAFCESKSAY